MSWENSLIRRVIVEARSANSYALIRRAAAAWAGTRPGHHLTWLIEELDGGTEVSDARMRDIRSVGYFHTDSGDGLGDDIWTLHDAVLERRQDKALEGT